MPHLKLLLAAAASLTFSSLAFAQPAPAPAPTGGGATDTAAAGVPGQPVARAPSPRAAACHNGMSFDRFLADLKQQAVAEGVSQRALGEAAPYLVYDQSIVNRDRGQRVFGQVFTELHETGRPMARQKMRRRESGCMRRRSTAPRRNMACRPR